MTVASLSAYVPPAAALRTDVQSLLDRHPSVASASVVSERSPYWGETLSAFVRLNDGRPGDGAADAPTSGDLRRWLAARLGHAATPRRIVIL